MSILFLGADSTVVSSFVLWHSSGFVVALMRVRGSLMRVLELPKCLVVIPQNDGM